jgi:glycosyltransferase involved in cell wall biosynthesis
LRLAAELHRHPPDVFFTPAHVIPLSYFGPAVATIHDVGYHYFPEAHPARQLRYLRWSTRHNGRRAGRIVADSQATMADLVRLDGLDPAKIAVVDPGVDPTLHREEDAAHMTAVQQSYGITTSYFLYLSTIQPRKNLVRLIEAYAQSGVPHQLVLAGKIGWLAQPILDAIANLPTAVRQQIILPGFIPDADKAALLSGATALLYPSLYEGFGFPILEAQACGLPVLTANSSSCPEVAGGAALLVNPLDVADIIRGMQQLAEDAALRHRLAAAGLVNVRRFSWAQTAVQVLDLLELVTR